MANERKLVQLQGFAKIEYGESTVKFILLNQQGQVIDEQLPLMAFSYRDIVDKQVFTIHMGLAQVQFVNVLLRNIDEEKLKNLKDLTHSVANWETTELQTLTAEMAYKDPTRPPRKDEMVNSLREWHIVNGKLTSVSRVVNPVQH